MKDMEVWIWSTIETPRRGSGMRRVLVKEGRRKNLRRLFDPRDPFGHPDVVDVATLERLTTAAEKRRTIT